MSIRTCLHPRCDAEIPRGISCCKRHWFRLTRDLQQMLRNCRTETEINQVAPEIEEYFESRMIGDHEIVTCRGANCHGDIVWMTGYRRDGKPFRVPVDASSIDDDDADFDRNKHQVHWETCPDADEFRRPR